MERFSCKLNDAAFAAEQYSKGIKLYIGQTTQLSGKVG